MHIYGMEVNIETCIEISPRFYILSHYRNYVKQCKRITWNIDSKDADWKLNISL